VSAALLAGGCATEIRVEQRYLHFPVAGEGEARLVKLMDGEELVRYFEIALPEQKSDARFWSSTDMEAFRGKTLTVEMESSDDEARVAELCEQSGEVRRPPGVYREARRPQFHFSPMAGWTNDPNGLVYYDGEYHLFFQHNPYGIPWGNMTWGHAVSPDLIHWREIGDAIHPDELGTVFSGSAVVDHKNSSGLGAAGEPPMLAFYTAAGSHAPAPVPFTQAMAYSTDRGRTWTKYEGNPVVEFFEEGNRDPKVFWHEPAGKWIMVLWVTRGNFFVLGSENLKDWEKLSDLAFPDGYECPELFELAVDGNADDTRWVMWDAAGRHLIGRFDGQTFTAESEVLPSEWGRNAYAAQTWNDVPDGRRILIPWMRTGAGDEPDAFPFEGMPFNQQMGIPRTLTLRTTPDGIRLFAKPVREVETLYGERRRLTNVPLTAGANPLADIEGELFDIAADLAPGRAESVTLEVRGTPIVYDVADGRLSCLGHSVEFKPTGGQLDLRVLVDRTSIEVFADEGRYVMSFTFRPDESNRGVSLSAEGGTARAISLEVAELRSIWQQAASE